MKSKLFSMLLCAAFIMNVPMSLLTTSVLADTDEEIVSAEAPSDSAEASAETAAEEEEAQIRETGEEAPASAETLSDDGETAADADGDTGSEEHVLLTEGDFDPFSAAAGMDTASVAAAFSSRAVTFDSFTPRALSKEILHKGIDVSAWQGSIDWNKVAADGVEFVIIRAAYRTTSSGTLAADAMFKTYIKGAKAAGLKVGAYIFSQAITTAEATAEADYLMELVKDYEIDLPLVLDFEHYTGGRLLNANLSKQAATDICNAFCDRVEQYGYESMVYANIDMLTNYLYPTQIGRLWLAHWTSKSGYSARDYEYWQCSGSGTVSGISDSVDLDFWFEPVLFCDINESDWYYEDVTAAYNAGIVTGVSATAFSPNTTATRGQVVTMLYRMAGEPSWSAAASFTDLTQSYYRDAVYWAAENGIVNGFSETTFGPGESITREQLLTILYRMAGSPATEGGLEGYTDAGDVQSWAADAMAWAVETGVVTGYEDGTLRPQRTATRAEVCTLIMRYAAL